MRRTLFIAFGFLILNSAYLALFPTPTIFYMANVVLHLGVGVALMIAAAGLWRRYPRETTAFLIAGAPALLLAITGNTLQHRWLLYLHMALSLAAILFIGLRARGTGL